MNKEHQRVNNPLDETLRQWNGAWRKHRKHTPRHSADHSLMKILRGSGNTFSTSGREWLPFRYNPTIGRQRARALRIKRKGLALPDDKASMRAIGEQAKATFKRP